MSAKPKVRVTIDLSERSFQRLEALQERVDAPSKASLIREALQLYEYVADHALRGHEFRVTSESGETERIAFLGPRG